MDKNLVSRSCKKIGFFRMYAVAFLLTFLVISCHNTNKEADTKQSELPAQLPSAEKLNEVKLFAPDKMIKELQGKWKEARYPFRTAHFKDTTVKFIDEAVIDEPTFHAFSISQHCPFEVNNLKNAGFNDLFLVMASAKSCEILKIANNTLTLSGFNVSSNLDYQIVYNRVD